MKKYNSIFKNLSLILIQIFFLSCSIISKKKDPVQAPPSVKKEFNQVQIDMAAGADQKALKRLQNIVSTMNDTDAADDAYILMGQIYMKQRSYKNAFEAYISVVNSDVFSPKESDALIGASKALSKLGQYDEVLSLTNKCLSLPNLSKEAKLENHRIRFNVLNEVGDKLDALRSVIYLSENEESEKSRNAYKLRAYEYVDSNLSDKDLEIVVSDSSFGYVRATTYLKIGNLLFEQRDFWRAKDYLEEAIRLEPETEVSEKANFLLRQIEARRKVDPNVVGTILPLTGKASSFAYKTLKGLQLGLGIYGPNPSRLKLAVVDSEGNPDAARRGVERLVTEDHVIGIIGSLLSKTAVGVASKADELGVPNIALSQKASLTDIGQTVYRNSLTSEMLIRKLVDVSMNNYGYKRFAILYPNDPYGIEYANLFWDEVLARGGEIRAAQIYDSKESDFRGPIQRLIGTFYVEDRLDEYKSLLKNWHQKNKSIGGRVSPPDNILAPVLDFDAIFIPDSIRAVGQIAPMLAYQDVNNIQLLGTNLWNSGALIQKGERFVEGAIFVDGLLSSDDKFKSSKFYKDYKTTFNEEPGLFEAQAYDAGLIIRQLIESGENSRVGLTEKLNGFKSKYGSLGSLTMNSLKEIERPVYALGVQKGSIQVLPTNKQ